jgi:hypothetical protein
VEATLLSREPHTRPAVDRLPVIEKDDASGFECGADIGHRSRQQFFSTLKPRDRICRDASGFCNLANAEIEGGAGHPGLRSGNHLIDAPKVVCGTATS